MSGALLQQSTSRIENRSTPKTISSNETFEQNCTTIECFGKSMCLIRHQNKEKLLLLVDEIIQLQEKS